ncbi:MAG: beta-lactam-binding protein with PASTA domain [Crocinitomicaceae bacterium]|jgi:beta-lactam-binding protein with PASTA domain
MEILKKLGNYIWSKQFGINLGVIILVYILGYQLLTRCLDSRTNHGVKTIVPNLVGKNQNNVKNLLSTTGLEYEVLDSLYDPTKVEGTVLSQDPRPTTATDIFVKPGRSIKLRVSKRTQLLDMPGLVDKSQRFAETILKSRGFRYKLEYKSSREAHGAVLQQLYKNKPIAEGTRIPIGSSIKLIVGRDQAGVPQSLPDLFGLTIAEARARVAKMIDMDFQVACPECITPADSVNMRVETQSPEFTEDARVASGSTILIYATKPEEPEN